MSGSGDNRSVTAREITSSTIVTGDHNTVSTTMKQIALPAADQVDVKAELAALRDALAELQKVPDRGKLDRAIEDAVEETGRANPDKAEVGDALERVGKYAKAADDSVSTPKSCCRASLRWARGLAPTGIICSLCSASPHNFGDLSARPAMSGSRHFPVIPGFGDMGSRSPVAKG
jgi:hypothetical protein